MKFLYSSVPASCVALALTCISAIQLQAQGTQQTTATAPSTVAPSVTSDQQPNDPALTIRAEKAAADAEPAANEEYTLGAGDQITLSFPGRTELSGIHTIGPDGRITLPLAGPVRVAGLTRTAAGDAIVAALNTYYTDLSVTVGIDKYTSNRVQVLGYVQHPGQISFEETPTLLNAISKAGLIAPTVTKDGVTTAIGSGIPELVTVYRGNNETYQVQLRSLLMSGNIKADMRLRRNDIIYVPEPKEQFVSVIGEVTRPGTIALTPASTLTSVLSEAGCCSEGGGFNPQIRILQPSTGKQFTVKYKNLMTLVAQQEYTLHSGDVIFIPKSGPYKFAYIMQKLTPITTMVSIAAIAGVF